MRSAAPITLAVISFALGLVAAWRWYQSSRIPIQPAWELRIEAPVDRNIMGHVAGLQIALTKASRLNKAAASWTVASVLFSAAIAGAWPSN